MLGDYIYKPHVLSVWPQSLTDFNKYADFNKKHRTATTLISSHKSIKQQPHLSAAMNQKIKITAPSKNVFQNIGALQNCSLQKCISKLMSLKYTLIKEILTDEHK